MSDKPKQLSTFVSQEILLQAIQQLLERKVVIVGDVMLDEYIFGSVERISPEAPVPVVRVDNVEYRLGGAGNVAKNIAALGGHTRLFGFVGKDGAAERLREMFTAHQIDNRCIEECDRPTTRKTRIIAQQQQVVRVDRESSCIPSAEGVETLLSGIADALQTSPVLIISDYGKGLISGSLMDRIRGLSASLAHKPLILVDPKPRNYAAYKGVSLLTPNTKEAGIEFQLTGSPSDEDALYGEIGRAGKKLLRDLESEQLLITLGSRGMMLFTSQYEAIHIPTAARKVYDVTGAGDTVIAVLGLALAAGLEPLTACLLANYAAGIVVGQIGATAVSPEQLKEAVMTWPLLQARKMHLN